ncbi:MAG TPA: cytochrome c oxidase subunit II [Thermoanaerobaculia bacterium]|nr:cytochrome c oxidase subunit II [Thermoanaerobaculia bacterium]
MKVPARAPFARASARGATALALIAAAGCRGIQSALDPAGREASRIAGLWWFLFWTCTAVFVVVTAALLVALFRRRTAQSADPKRGRALIVGAVGATAAILLLFLIVSVSAGRAVAEPAGPNVLRVQVTGHQWWWEIHYPGTPDNRDVVTANEIHVPVGRPVLLELTSADVIHSFWAPNFHGKKDLIPGLKNTHLFRAERPGVFRGQCAEFCGLEHAKMAFTIVADPPEKFDRWYESQLLPAAEPATPSETHGRDVFLSSPCMFCHSIKGTPAFGMEAPDLTHVASRHTLAAGTVPNNRGNLAGWIADPQSMKPGNHMPPMAMPGDDLLALTDYLESLK